MAAPVAAAGGNRNDRTAGPCRQRFRTQGKGQSGHPARSHPGAASCRSGRRVQWKQNARDGEIALNEQDCIAADGPGARAGRRPRHETCAAHGALNAGQAPDCWMVRSEEVRQSFNFNRF